MNDAEFKKWWDEYELKDDPVRMGLSMKTWIASRETPSQRLQKAKAEAFDHIQDEHELHCNGGECYYMDTMVPLIMGERNKIQQLKQEIENALD